MCHMTDREGEVIDEIISRDSTSVSHESKLDNVQPLSSELNSNDLPHFNPSSVFIIIYT